MMEKEMAVRAHRAVFEDPERLGDPVEDWVDEEGYLCIRWSCGQWWHYRTDRTGAIVWW